MMLRSAVPLVRALPVALTVILGLLIAGCGQRETAVEAGNRDQIIHIGNLVEPSDLDPHIAATTNDFHIIMSLFEGLVQYDPKTSEPIPAAAESWETSADGLTWTFHLQRNAKWSNGDPLTAQDFVYAYRRILMPYFYARNNLRRPEVKGWYGNLLDNHPLKGVYLDPAAAVK